jgi:hypothetical protein
MSGVAELEIGHTPSDRVRRAGGGRKRLAELDTGLRPALLALVEPDERGDPMSPLRWTTKSTRRLAAELTRAGHRISADTVADQLREEGFSQQANAKNIEGSIPTGTRSGVHDFAGPALGKAIPYGIYELTASPAAAASTERSQWAGATSSRTAGNPSPPPKPA